MFGRMHIWQSGWCLALATCESADKSQIIARGAFMVNNNTSSIAHSLCLSRVAHAHHPAWGGFAIWLLARIAARLRRWHWGCLISTASNSSRLLFSSFDWHIFPHYVNAFSSGLSAFSVPKHLSGIVLRVPADCVGDDGLTLTSRNHSELGEIIRRSAPGGGCFCDVVNNLYLYCGLVWIKLTGWQVQFLGLGMFRNIFNICSTNLPSFVIEICLWVGLQID